ncbi:MAG: tetratricopeptide repeat protein [Pseudomonadota bacterium]
MSIHSKISAVSVALATALAAPHVTAQDSMADLFEALYENPADRTLMLGYARASVLEGDYEAAVATLERLIDLEPSNQEARLELAKGYFALGQNALAQYHLDIYLQGGDLTPEEVSAATALVAKASARESGFDARGSIEAGVVNSSELGETGLSYRAAARLSWDLGGANPHTWDATVRFTGRSYDSETTSDSHRFVFRTGPTLLLAGQAFGPRLQPYLEFGSVDDDDVIEDGDRFYGGLYFIQPINAQWSVFADVAYGTLDRNDTVGDADVLRATVGADFWATEDVRLRVVLLHQDEDADTGGVDRERNSARLDAMYRFSPGFNQTSRAWQLRAFVQTDQETSTGSVDDDYVTYGASLKAYVRNNTFLRLAARHVDRDSTSAGQSRDDTVVSLTAGWEF